MKCETHDCVMAELWKCGLCSFLCLYLFQLLSHLNTLHKSDVNFHQECGLPDCSSETHYTSANSLVKHVRTKHHAILGYTYGMVFSTPSGNQLVSEDTANVAGNFIFKA